MNILMMTNTYLPQVRGVARSVSSFTEMLRRRGQRVLVVAPTFKGCPDRESGVVRVPALQRFNGSDFSVRLPIPGLLSSQIDQFEPHVIHAHHPFLLGDTALRAATWRNLPLVFTHHTMYEQYTLYVPGDNSAMRRFAMRLATEYANLCDHVIAPSESIRQVLIQRGVRTPITAIPTGIDCAKFANGDGAQLRREYGIPVDAQVIGHLGRLAPEKNLAFLSKAVVDIVARRPKVHFLVVGSGPSREQIEAIFAERGVADRLHLTGSLDGQPLVNAYHAMDVFVFASQSETQGMVLAEAMAAGVPVVAVDAPGAREIVRDGRNGHLLSGENEMRFIEAVQDVLDADAQRRAALHEAARATAEDFSLERCTERLIALYEELAGMRRRDARRKVVGVEDNPWTQTLRMLETEWKLWNRRREAAMASFRKDA